MRQMMGFSGFGTTQGTTADANKGSASGKGFIRAATSTRQYRLSTSSNTSGEVSPPARTFS